MKKMVPHSQKLSKLAQRFEHWSSPEQIRMLFDSNGLPRECGV
jgi:hypothetical protein